MPTLPQAGPSVELDTALLARARLALQSLKFEEQAARYRAACAALLEAIAEAEAGNERPLRQWLEERSSHLIADRTIPEEYPRRPEPKSTTDLTPIPDVSDVSDVADVVDVVDVADVVDAADAAANADAHPVSSEESKSIRIDAAHATHPVASPLDASPWDLMHGSALERAIYWTANTHQASESKTTSSPMLESIVGRVQRAPSQNSKPWWSVPHVYISLIVHAILLLAFSIWVITTVQNPLVLSLVAANVESEDVLADTPLEMPATLEQSQDDSPSLPSVDSMVTPVDLPAISASDLGVGPRIADIATSNNTHQAMLASATGTKFVDGAEFFGSKAAGNTFVFVVDCSPSMLRDGAFDTAKSEILKSLSLLKPKQRYFVSFFGKEIIPIQFRGSDPEPFAIRATPENLEKTVEWVQRVPIQKDGRPPIDALGEAIAMQPDGIFLLFDGDTKVDRWTSKIQERNRVDGFLSDNTPKVPIHVVHFFREEFEKEMRTLAAENGGTYRFIPRPQKASRGLK